MAGVRFAATTAEIAIGTSIKTLLQLIAAANHRIKIVEWNISFQGITATGEPILVEVLRQTSAGTTSALTPRKLDDSDDETLQVTALHTATVEPSDGGEVLHTELVHPQTGYTWFAPSGRELLIGGGDRLGLRVTAGASINAIARMVGEE